VVLLANAVFGYRGGGQVDGGVVGDLAQVSRGFMAVVVLSIP